MRDIYQGADEVVIWLGESRACDDMGHRVEMNEEEEAAVTATTADSAALHHAHENPNIVRWFGDERDLPKLRAYFSMDDAAGAAADESRCDIFGAFAVLHLLASGVPVDKIWHLRHVRFSSGIVNGINAIMERAWWRRIWVVQETVVAKAPVIMYGSLCAPWRMFALAAVEYDTSRAAQSSEGSLSQLLKSGQTLMQFTRAIMEIESTRRSWQKSGPLVPLTLLRKFRSREATDARDKVFALLGIIRTWGTERYGQAMEGIKANYSVGSDQIFFKTAELLIRNTRSLAVLAGTLQGPSSPSMPSWVTDWWCPPMTNEHIRVGNISFYNTARYISGRVALHSGSILEAQGAIIDKVDYVGEFLGNELGRSRSRLVVQAWRKSLAGDAESIEGRYVGGGSLRSAFWRTLCADLEFVQHSESSAYVREFRRIPEPVAASEGYESWIRVDEQSRRRTSLVDGLWVEPTDGTTDTLIKNNFQYMLECASGGRRFFRTERGYVGTGPADVKVGDSVAVLVGCRVPFLLREVHRPTERCSGQEIRVLFTQEPGYYEAGKGATVQKDEVAHCYSLHRHCHRVVGDAYVHGIMDGEIKSTRNWNLGPIYIT
ncbi:hypothetical protein F5Y17DRAFT_414234 [Xylariaceae sp. FL0594]|nr:hypothetical protein F5Y17DRAFT_414234 [Xylariaceae sp. FL0594]